MRKFVCIIFLLGCFFYASADPGYPITYTGATTFCQGGSILLNANGAPAGYSIAWTRNNVLIGSTGTVYTANTTGSYSAIATLAGNPDIHYDTVNIVVNPNPTAAFIPSANNICISTPVSFTNTSSGSGLSYSWNFGDPNSGTNNTSTATHPTHRFIGSPGTTPQIFKVKLTVTSNTGCVHADSINITVNESPGTQLIGTGFTAPNTFRSCGTSATTFTFLNQSSTVASNISYRIIWGDASPDFTTNSATNWSTTHNFGIGSHPINFIVTGAGGCIDTVTYYVFVGTNPGVSLGNPGNTSICTGDSLTFPISNISTNAPGTLYTIAFNDGQTTTFTHPAAPGAPPTSITRAFNTMSCGTNSSNGSTTFTNSFSATITASNPCGTSSGSVVPIYVSSTPLATMVVGPRDTVCVNTAVTITSTSPLNQSVDAGSGSCTPGRNVWTITPAVGYTITSGTLGNTNGFSDPSIWTNGTSALGLNFTATGTYSISLITGNSAQCRTDTVTRTICVNPQPTSDFTIDNNEGCTPVNVATTNNSNTPICGGNTYTWTITYSNAQGCTPNSSNYTITSGSLTSVNPSFQFINPGVYTITLVTRNSDGACVSPPTSRTVTVKSRPNAAIAAIAPICQNASATPVATINNCYSTTPATYAWTFDNGTPATATTLNPGAITYNTSGTHNITLDVTNECGVTQAIRTIQVNPRPDITVPSNLTLCPGEPTGALTFSSALAGTTFSWTNSNTAIGLAASGNGNIATFNVTNAGATAITSTITVTATNGGCTNTATFTITVNPRPSAPVVTTPVTYCQNATASALTATATAGNTLLWYTSASGGVGSATAPTPSTATIGTTNYYVSQINTTSNCESNRSLIAVIINESPVISSAVGTNPTSCSSSTGSILLTGLTPGNSYTVSYVRNGGAPVILNNQLANASGNITISSLASGTYTSITVTRNGCTSPAMGPVVLSDPSSPNTPTITTNATSPLCSGSTLTLSANTSSGAATYNWGGPNGFTSNIFNPTITNVTTAASGLYTVTATISGCTSPAGFVTIIIDSTPAVPTVGSNTPVCTGNTLNLTSNSATAGVSYSWTGPNAFSSAVQNPTRANVTAADAGNYIVTATLGNCTSNNSTTVTINPTPVIGGSSSTNPTNCASSTGTITLTGLTPGTYTVSYIRNGAAPTILNNVTANASGEIIITGLNAGVYTNIFVTLNGCNSIPLATTFTLSDPTPPATPTIITNAPICSGNTLTLEASTTSVGTVTYSWIGPNTFTSNIANPSITNVTTAASGIYNVSATINGCTSLSGTTNITVNPTPVTPTVGSNTPVCTGNTLNLTANSTTPGVNYSWTGPNTFSSNVQNPTKTNVTIADAGSYTVTAALGSCSSNNSTIVAINPTPVISGSSSSNPTNCATATGTITLTGLTANTSYSVSYVRNGAAPTVVNNVTANTAGEVIITGLSAGVYTNIFVTLNGCNATPLAATITLSDPTPPATPAVTTNAPICSGSLLQLFANSASTGSITYTWSGPNNFTSTQQNPTIAATTLAANGNYNVTATLNSCTSLAGTINVLINETPATPVANNNGPICADSTLNLTATTSFAGAVSWSWNGPNAFASSTQNPSITNATIAATGTYNVIATSTTGNCPSIPGGTNVVVNPTPVISGATFTNPIQCLSATGTIILNGLSPLTAYTVTYTRNTVPVSTTITSEATGSLIIPLLSAATYANVRVTTLAGCPSNIVGPFTLVDPNPPAVPTAGSNSPICTGETLTLTANTITPGTITYTWTGPAAFSSNVQNPSIINATPVNSGPYNVTATLNNCVSPPTSVLVDVTALPSPPTVTTPVNYCIDAPSVPLTATTVPGNTLRWYTTAVGGTGSATAPTPTTNATGITTYYVSQVTALGCEGTRAAIDVIVNPDALAQFVSSPLINCAPFNIDATVIQPTVHPTRNNIYNWYANGVLIGIGTTTFPGYTIAQPGDSVLIKLTTTSLFGCKSDSVSRWLYTFPVPFTDFTATDTVGCGPLSVTFTNTTPMPGNYSFNWNFGNGITSSAVNPGTTIFQPNPTAGDTVYNVSLAAYTQCDTIIKVVPIRVKSRPQAIITPDKTYGCSPLTVVFSNISLGVNMTFEWNFGDGSPSFFTNNTSSVQHTYNTAQQDTFYVRLIATNDCGSDTGYYNIVVAARTINLDVAINGNQTTGCAPHAVRFFNNSTGATNFVWDFGDGNVRSTTNNIDTLDHTYLTSGTFTVMISASNGCTDTTITETISVFAKPLVNFAALPSPVCIGDTVFFTNQTDTATGLLWNFGDGITSQLTNPVHAYQTPGTYDVKLIGIRQYAPGNACTDSITKQITVVATLPGSFTVSDSVGNCIPFTVTFTNQTLPSALTTWNFGNGAVDTGNVVNYTFTQGGTFIVTMTVRDPNGCTYIATRQIIVNGPAGSFIYDNGFICGNTPIRFEANTTGTDSIHWNFGDGMILTSTANIVYHVYNQPGIYIPTAQLLAGVGGSCSRLLTGADTIRVDYVSAGFTSTQLRLCGTTTVNFNDTSRSYFPMQSWQWSFGDGNVSGVRHPNHTYTSTNTWPIQLIATSGSGCADTTIVPVFVKVDVKPEASIVHDPFGCVNQPVIYNSVVISPDPITYYSWTFSNLASGNTATVTNNYAAPGIYTAQLITGTSFGCYDTATSTITINPSPFVNTNPNMVICRGESAQLTVTGGLTYTWAPFTGLSCNNCPNPIASPLTTTQYVVSGFNSFGCAARDTILITVPQPIDVNATANTVMCIGDAVQLNATGAASYLWSPANTLNNANIPNPIATPPATTLYRVIGFDGANCFQDTAFVTVSVGNYPIVNVGIDRLVATGELINLAPTVTNGPIAIWNWTPPTDLSCATCPSPIATAKKEICYTVTATNFFGCSGSDTMCIRVFCESSQVFIPNAFTPDADGINDILVVKAQGVKAVKSFRIFNRWGQLVFEKSSFPPNVDSYGWDGKVKGVAAPPDVYVYTCEVVCENDVPYTYKGNVAILK
jgi:large repetitive protein